MPYFIKTYVGGLESALLIRKTEQEVREVVSLYEVKQIINGRDVTRKFIKCRK